jgi:hypothetical protein
LSQDATSTVCHRPPTEAAIRRPFRPRGDYRRSAEASNDNISNDRNAVPVARRRHRHSSIRY